MRNNRTYQFFALSISLLCTQVLLGASFIFTPFDKQLRDSDAAVLGTVKSSTVKKNPRGEVVTRYEIELSWAAGLDRNQGIHPKSFHINVPGGSWQGIDYQVSGAPHFSPRDEAFLLLKESKFGHTVFNLSLGKYQVVRKGKQVLLKSSVFPDHPKLGQVQMKNVKAMAEEKFQASIDYKKDEQKIAGQLSPKKKNSTKFKKEGKSRGPASITQKKESGHSHSNLFWPFVVLVLVALSRKIFRLRAK